MATLRTHDPYKPGKWATEQIRLWQRNRGAALGHVRQIMDRIGAAGVFAHDRVIGFWFENNKPPHEKDWAYVKSGNRTTVHGNIVAGAFSSSVGPGSRIIWRPRKKVMRGRALVAHPLAEEIEMIRIPDWWDLAASLTLRPMIWPIQGVMLLPELEVLGDHGEHTIVWSPRDRFGQSLCPMDSESMTQDQVRAIYGSAYNDLKRMPVVESYIGGEIKYRFAKDQEPPDAAEDDE